MRFRSGDFYIIKFWDHAIGIERPIQAEASGWLLDSTDLYLHLTTWQVLDDDKEVVKDNREHLIIIRSAIIKATKVSR